MPDKEICPICNKGNIRIKNGQSFCVLPLNIEEQMIKAGKLKAKKNRIN